MAFANIERFAVLLELAEKIARRYANQDLVIIRTPDDMWLVTLRNWDSEDPLPRSGHADSLESALEAFVTSPRK
jgi:hypothetical protein